MNNLNLNFMNRRSTWKKATTLAATAALTAALALPVSAASPSMAPTAAVSTSSTTAQAASGVEDRLEKVAGFKSASNVRAYYANLQRAVAKGDKAGVAARIHYPLSVYSGDDNKQKMVIKTKAQLLKHYDRIFTQDIKENLAETSFSELFVNWQGASTDDGEIWITASKTGMPGISTVNLDD
ncbi:hypothetical protein B9G55_18285 [Saccharibacillus sp. O16]|nr:hypothetical protein B9G55_18285 [Saccharibacillus sp. O16]